MDNDEIKLLLVKYITREADEKEVEQVREWVSAHPENEQYFAQLYETWQNMLYLNPEIINGEKAFTKFSAATIPREPKYRRLAVWSKVAAAVALFGVLTVLLVNHYSQNIQSARQVSAQNGGIKKIVLSDGTLVWLNAGSKLNYNTDFNKTNRTVYLEGEAYFEIAPGKKTIPFLVNTKNYTVRDIGTKFNLKAYPNDSFFETTVVKGEVAVEGNVDNNTREMNRIYVKPRQLLRIYYPKAENYAAKEDNKDTKNLNEIQMLQVDSAKMNRYDGWKDDLLVFDGNTLDEISKVLERRYNVKIIMDDADLQNLRYSGSFKSVASIDKVLELIKGNTSINYSINGSTVNITKNNKNKTANP
ncbi:FecR family protein [Mucilaginibacter sp. FT3.2]|uniref:FecR family protein n=1 Tax=Mucilaginibacter sp. FT3.2 TaxID=2723090 RepID=UPI00161A6072|nr:FecR domain-containing protein [Mucilaginibacter sp. FT3.2]MBB6230734.1 ferric-dicitrate binding protein FerR (iron transport regulator) [Mucilaginibacter sp. FT3.2]